MPEQKMNVNKNAVQINADGHLQIQDKAVMQKLKENGVTNTNDLNKAAITVGVVVGN